MGFKQYSYTLTPSHLEGIDWVTSSVYAQLLNLTYTYSISHTTRNNIISAAISNPIQLTSKTKTVAGLSTFLSCSQIIFPNNPSAKYVVFLTGQANQPNLTDKVLGLVDLNDGIHSEVSVNFGIGFNGGLFTLTQGV